MPGCVIQECPNTVTAKNPLFDVEKIYGLFCDNCRKVYQEGSILVICQTCNKIATHYKAQNTQNYPLITYSENCYECSKKPNLKNLNLQKHFN